MRAALFVHFVVGSFLALSLNGMDLSPDHRISLFIMLEKAEKQFYLGLIDEGDHLAIPVLVREMCIPMEGQIKAFLHERFGITVSKKDIHTLAHFEAKEYGRKISEDYFGVAVNSENKGLKFSLMGPTALFFPKAHSTYKPIVNQQRVQSFQWILHYGLTGGLINDQAMEQFQKVIDSYGKEVTGYLSVDPQSFHRYLEARTKSNGCTLF